MMKISIFRIMFLAALLGLGQFPVYCGDIVTGWSDKATIVMIRHHSGVVDYLLTSSLSGCGTPSDSQSFWRQPVEDAIDNKDRRALLYLAYAAKKEVQLRCENSYVTDAIIWNE